MMLASNHNEAAVEYCPTCQRRIASGAPEGLCPHCLFDAGLPDTKEPTKEDRSTLRDHSAAPARYFGDYELLREAGRGGMGIVYEARQFGTKRLVALKLLSAGALATREAVNRFQTEAEAAARLEHAHIVPIYESGVHDGQHFLVMRFLPAATLAQKAAKGPLPPRRAAELVRIVAAAVQYAHQHGVLHRDLKPGNILLDAAGEPHVTDFGLARLAETDKGLTLPSSVLGTAAYMAPEQASGGASAITTSADIYGLGAVLYELLAGKPPFEGANFYETVRQIVEEQPVPPSLARLRVESGVRPAATTAEAAKSACSRGQRSRQLSIPADLETICLKCLEKDPARRYATAQNLADDLDRFLRGEPVLARPIGATARAWRWCCRKPVIAGLILGLNMALGLGLAGVLWQWRRAANGEIRARQNQYVSDMNRAKQAWEEGNLKLAQDLLRAHIPKPGERDLGGFEWRYLWNLCQDESLHVIPSDAADRIRGLIGSPKHEFIAAYGPRSIRLLEPSTGRELRRLSYPGPQTTATSPLVAVASAATNILAAHCGQGKAAVWDLTSQSPPLIFQAFTNELGTLALSPDGHFLAVGERSPHSHTLAVWDISSPGNLSQPVWSHQLDIDFTVIRFSPDAQTIIANGKVSPDGTIGAWDVATGRELASFPKDSVGLINDLAFSPDGNLLAASGVLGTINVWDFTNRAVQTQFAGHRGPVNALAFSSDGEHLASAGDDGTIRLWDIPSHQAIGMFRDPRNSAVLCVAFGPSEDCILSANEEELRIWPSAPRQTARILQTGQEWGEVVISPNGKWLATRGAAVEAKGYSEISGVTIWDLASGKQRFRLPHRDKQPEAATFSPDGTLFALGGEGPERVVEVWETSLWDRTNPALESVAHFTNDFEVGSICFSPDGKTMALAGIFFSPEMPSGATNRLAFREVGSWRILNILERAGAGETEQAAAATVAFSQNGRLLAVGYRNGWVRLWDFTGQRLLKAFQVKGGSYGAFVRFSGDNRWLCAANGQTVALFDVAKPQHAREVFSTKAHIGYCWSATFPPDSRSLVTAGNDGLIKFWNLDTLAVALTLEHSRGPGVRLNFSLDGNLLVSKDAAGLVKFWPASSFEQISKANRFSSHSLGPGGSEVMTAVSKP